MALLPKKKRKQRVIKGRYVEVDSIDVKPGNNYSNWIKIAKDQLKTRESKLLQVKIDATNKIVNDVLITHNIRSPTFVVSDLIINSTLNNVNLTINKWKGLQLSRCKTSLKRYRDYWNKSKKWFDQSKKKAFGDVYWYEIFITIEKFTNNNKNIILLMLSSLFNGTIDYNNTRKLSLINSSVATYSHKMQHYLQNLDTTLKINDWLRNPFVLMNNIRAQLNQLTSNLSCFSLTNLPNLPLPPTIDIDVNVPANNTIPTPSNTNNNQTINHTNNNNNNNMYVPVHTSSHTVSDLRYMPYSPSNNLNNNSNNSTVNHNGNAIYVNNNNNSNRNNSSYVNHNNNNNYNTMNNNNGPVQAQVILIGQNGSVSLHNVQLQF